ncbi:MAG: class I SAM-dependent methyltransferase [Actinomycetota bacterium]|nr:class I SAM-dependent methyltransferase [Actinomycetota bacterium]
MSAPSIEQDKARVRTHWEDRPCGTIDTLEPGTPEYFAEVERERWELEPFIPSFAEFWKWRGKRVLEIGVGQGTDHLQFARAGADLSGVDLTEASIELASRRLGFEGLESDLRRADAETLPFEDDTFDLVYSWGVLHHTPRTEEAIEEARRVCAPDGEARIMLYSSTSWCAWGHWLKYALAAGKPRRSVKDVLYHHMESYGTKAYTQPELEQLFARWSDVSFQRFLTPYDTRVGGPVARALGERYGWFVGIRARP